MSKALEIRLYWESHLEDIVERLNRGDGFTVELFHVEYAELFYAREAGLHADKVTHEWLLWDGWETDDQRLVLETESPERMLAFIQGLLYAKQGIEVGG